MNKNKQQTQKRCWKIFDRGALRLWGVAWHSKNWQNLHWFNSASRFNLGGLDFCLEG